ncbi:MAG: hypothetical protein IPM69_11395 [Ignavibacteria bacterium]|nr:hypothetical protein [Ignavibacteria bacterium]
MKLLPLLCLFAVSCNVFSTREPESPDSKRSSFLPPTSPQIVIVNFKNSLLEKNSENFVQCFADTSKGALSEFVFEPSASVNAQYPSLFQSWNRSSERQSFQSMMSKLPSDIIPALKLSNDRYDITTPDSSIYEADYTLTVAHTIQTIPTQVSGYMRFTIGSQSGGLWSIIRWSDSSPTQTDSLNRTWSLLKATFSN